MEEILKSRIQWTLVVIIMEKSVSIAPLIPVHACMGTLTTLGGWLSMIRERERERAQGTEDVVVAIC